MTTSNLPGNHQAHEDLADLFLTDGPMPYGPTGSSLGMDMVRPTRSPLIWAEPSASGRDIADSRSRTTSVQHFQTPMNGTKTRDDVTNGNPAAVSMLEEDEMRALLGGDGADGMPGHALHADVQHLANPIAGCGSKPAVDVLISVNLPLIHGPWIDCAAAAVVSAPIPFDQSGRESNGLIALLRDRGATLTLDLYDADRLLQGDAALRQEAAVPPRSLHEAHARLAPRNATWIVALQQAQDLALLTNIRVRRVVLVSGVDQAAIVAVYRLLKVEAVKWLDVAGIELVMVGAARERGEATAARIIEAARSFLRIDLRLACVIPRIEPARPLHFGRFAIEGRSAVEWINQDFQPGYLKSDATDGRTAMALGNAPATGKVRHSEQPSVRLRPRIGTSESGAGDSIMQRIESGEDAPIAAGSPAPVNGNMNGAREAANPVASCRCNDVTPMQEAVRSEPTTGLDAASLGSAEKSASKAGGVLARYIAGAHSLGNVCPLAPSVEIAVDYSGGRLLLLTAERSEVKVRSVVHVQDEDQGRAEGGWKAMATISPVDALMLARDWASVNLCLLRLILPQARFAGGDPTRLVDDSTPRPSEGRRTGSKADQNDVSIELHLFTDRPATRQGFVAAGSSIQVHLLMSEHQADRLSGMIHIPLCSC